jgi:hypothetical protein
MSEVDRFLGMHGQLDPFEKSRRQQARQDRADEREAERQRAEREQRREALLFANAQADDPLGKMTALQMRCGELADEVSDLEDRLDKKRRALASARSSLQFMADESMIVTEMAVRSAPITDPVYAATIRAREELQRAAEYAAERSREVDNYRAKYLAKVGQQ